MRHILYRCRECGESFGVTTEDAPDDIACECGGVAEWKKIRYGDPNDPVEGGLQVIIKGRAWDFDPKTLCPSIGVQKGGRTPTQQEALYGQIVRDAKRRADARDRDPGRKPDEVFKLKARIPRELYEARRRQTGNPRYWEEEGDAALKRDDLFLGRG